MIRPYIDSPWCTEYPVIGEITVINWFYVFIAPWNWAQSGKKLIVTFMVHAVCIQCGVWTFTWSLMHSVVTSKRFGQRLCRGSVPMYHWFWTKTMQCRIWISYLLCMSALSIYLFCVQLSSLVKVPVCISSCLLFRLKVTVYAYEVEIFGLELFGKACQENTHGIVTAEWFISAPRAGFSKLNF